MSDPAAVQQTRLAPQPTLLGLPTEMILHIISYLHLGDTYRVSIVCRQLRAITDIDWERLIEIMPLRLRTAFMFSAQEGMNLRWTCGTCGYLHWTSEIDIPSKRKAFTRQCPYVNESKNPVATCCATKFNEGGQYTLEEPHVQMALRLHKAGDSRTQKETDCLVSLLLPCQLQSVRPDNRRFRFTFTAEPVIATFPNDDHHFMLKMEWEIDHPGRLPAEVYPEEIQCCAHVNTTKARFHYRMFKNQMALEALKRLEPQKEGTDSVQTTVVGQASDNDQGIDHMLSYSKPDKLLASALLREDGTETEGSCVYCDMDWMVTAYPERVTLTVWRDLGGLGPPDESRWRRFRMGFHNLRFARWVDRPYNEHPGLTRLQYERCNGSDKRAAGKI